MTGRGMISMNKRLIPWLLAYFSATILFVFLTPPFQTPDEPAHVAIAMVYAQNLPEDREIIESRVLNRLPDFNFWEYVHLPAPDPPPQRLYDAPLLRTKPTQLSKAQGYYKIIGYTLARLNITDPLSAMYLMRLYGAILALIAAIIFAFSVSAFFHRHEIQVAALSSLAIPQFVFISSSANPGTLAWITAGIIIMGAILLFRGKGKLFPIGLILGGICLAAITHRAALTVIPGVLVALGLSGYRKPTHIVTRRSGLPALIISTVILLGWLSVTWLQPGLVRSLITRIFHTIHRLGVNIALDIFTPDWIALFLNQYHRSFWLGFGWLKVFGPDWVYGCAAVHYILPTAGLILLFLRRESLILSSNFRKLTFSILIVALGAFWGGAVLFGLQKELSQGRYIFPALPALAILATAGWFTLVPEKHHRFLSLCIVFSAWTFLGFALIITLVKGFYFS